MSILLPEVIKGMNECLGQTFYVQSRIPTKPTFADYYKNVYRTFYVSGVEFMPDLYKNTDYGNRYYPHGLTTSYIPVPKGGLELMPIRGFVGTSLISQVIAEPRNTYDVYREHMVLAIKPEDLGKIEAIESETHTYVNLIKILLPICPLYLASVAEFIETKPYKR